MRATGDDDHGPPDSPLCDSVVYLVDHEVPGAIVECGMWRKGSMMAVAVTLLRRGAAERGLFLFGTRVGVEQTS